MFIVGFLILAGAVTVLWLAAGYFEWEIPPALNRKISGLIPAEREEAKVVFADLPIEILELEHDDMEKEIYIIRKSRKSSRQETTLKVEVRTPEGMLTKEEKKKAKLRLERRFPGITINFAEKEQEEKDASLYAGAEN